VKQSDQRRREAGWLSSKINEYGYATG